jgi:3-dehydroquinate dehydratase-2
MKRIMVLNGPNLNLLGQRNPAVYGTQTYADLERYLHHQVKEHEVTVHLIQSNHEGELIDALHHAHHERFDAVLFNPGAYTHYAYALTDAIEAITPPVIEVHLSDIASREEPWRRHSVIESVCIARFLGQGFESYREALEFALKLS